jgi:hypothetical protein
MSRDVLCVRPLEGPVVTLNRRLDGHESLCKLLKDTIMMITTTTMVMKHKQEKNKKRDQKNKRERKRRRG